MTMQVPRLKRRFACLIYELLLLLAVEFFLFLLPSTALGGYGGILLPGNILLLYAILVALVYFVWFWHREGQTLAMRTWKIRLVNADGQRAPIHRLCLRFMWAMLLGTPLLGFIWAWLDRDAQFLHDRLAGTRLVQTNMQT